MGEIFCFFIELINSQMVAPKPMGRAMINILQINSSLYSSGGQSSRLADEFVARLLDPNPGAKLTVRDLARDPVPHLDAERFAAFTAKPEERSAAQNAVVGYSDALIDELKRADVIVLGLPMYNFGVPSQLKAWFDHIARAGETFRYTEKGPVGLLTGKKAYVFAARGGLYAGTPRTRRPTTCAISCASSASPTWSSSTPKALQSARRASIARREYAAQRATPEPLLVPPGGAARRVNAMTTRTLQESSPRSPPRTAPA